MFSHEVDKLSQETFDYNYCMDDAGMDGRVSGREETENMSNCTITLMAVEVLLVDEEQKEQRVGQGERKEKPWTLYLSVAIIHFHCVFMPGIGLDHRTSKYSIT